MREPETWQEQRARLQAMSADSSGQWPYDRAAILAALARIDELSKACRKALESNAHRHGLHCECYTCVLLRLSVAKAGGA